MKNNNNRADDLRRRAVAMISEDSEDMDCSPDEMKKMLYELRVHQLELEMQNDELRKVHMELHATQARYFDLYDLAPIAYFTLSNQGLILQANLVTANLLGVVKGLLIEQPLSRFIFNEDQDIFYLHLKQLFKTYTPQSCELRMVKNNGTQFWAQIQTTITLNVNGNDVEELRSVLSDVTQRKQEEVVLQQTEAFKQAVLNSIAAEIVVLDHQGMIQMVNEHWRRFALNNNTSHEQPVPGIDIGANYLAIAQANGQGFSEDMMPEAHNGIRAVLNGSLPSFSLEYPCHSPQQQRWFCMCVTPLGAPAPTGVVITHTDITVRKQAEEALQESERMFRSLLQDSNDVILLADIYGNFEQINHAGEILLGYSRNEICQMNISQILPAAELAKVKQHFATIASKGEAPPLATKILPKDGRVVEVEIRPSLIKINGHKLVQGIFIDLTERNHQENERLEREMKLRLVLVREVHHRIKNNLQGITGILRSYTQQHPETAVPINQAISQMQSIAVIHGLQGNAVTTSVRVYELTIAIASGIESLWQKPVTVDIPDDWSPCLITEAEAVPLALVLNELISNSVKHGGTDEPIRITLSHKPNLASIKLTIHNTGLIPYGFGLEDTSDFGTGLQLVASLLPRTGAQLNWAQQGDSVVTTLSLAEPVIQQEAHI